MRNQNVSTESAKKQIANENEASSVSNAASSTAAPEETMPSDDLIGKVNPHFGQVERAPYEFFRLMREMPEDFSSTHPCSHHTYQKVQAAGDHAYNMRAELLRGLEALGTVMWSAANNDEQDVMPMVLGDIGTLINHMAVTLQYVCEFESEARTTRHMRDVRLLKGGAA
jgi:hypothetical protein